MSDKPTPVEVRVRVDSPYFESMQRAVALVGPDGEDARAAAAELLATLSQRVAESIGEVLPMVDATLLVDALADRLNLSSYSEDFTGENGALDLDQAVEYLGGHMERLRRQLTQADEQSAANSAGIRDARKLLDNIGLKVKAERAVAGDLGWLGVDEVEAILAGRAVPVGRSEHPLALLKKHHAALVGTVKRMYTKACTGYQGSPVTAAQEVLNAIESVMDHHDVQTLDDLKMVVFLSQGVAEKMGLGSNPTENDIRTTVDELATSREVLLNTAAMLGCRPMLVGSEVASLKGFFAAIADAVSLPRSATPGLLVDEIAMVKSNLDMLREVDKRIGALVVSELGIQEEALRPQGQLDQDVRAAIEHARTGQPLGDVAVALGLPPEASVHDIAFTVRERNSRIDRMDANYRTWMAQKRKVAELLLDAGLVEVDANRLEASVAAALSLVQEKGSADIGMVLASMVSALGLPLSASADEAAVRARALAEANQQMREQLAGIVTAVRRFEVFEGDVHVDNVAYRLSTLLSADELPVLPPLGHPVAAMHSGALNPRVRAVRIRQDIERDRDVLYVRDLGAPDMFTATGKDGYGVRYAWDALVDEGEEVVDASLEVRYQAVYQPANAGRDDQIAVLDTVTGEFVDAFHNQRTAVADIARRHASARPAMLS